MVIYSIASYSYVQYMNYMYTYMYVILKENRVDFHIRVIYMYVAAAIMITSPAPVRCSHYTYCNIHYCLVKVEKRPVSGRYPRNQLNTLGLSCE